MKSALITGGSRGIGKAICVQLSKDSGYHIIINYRSNKEAAEDTLKLVQENGSTGEILQFDVADAKDVKNKLDTWLENNEEGIIG
jgi:3-oxoacyl-[acyl-carrier protein] reductase